jgi:hypothetical protein
MKKPIGCQVARTHPSSISTRTSWTRSRIERGASSPRPLWSGWRRSLVGPALASGTARMETIA